VAWMRPKLAKKRRSHKAQAIPNHYVCNGASEPQYGAGLFHMDHCTRLPHY
jgi:hypothetical protein